MKKKLVTTIIIFVIFFVFSKGYVFAEGSCRCKPQAIDSAPGSPVFCNPDNTFPNTCSNGTIPKCLAGEGSNVCGSGNACECRAISAPVNPEPPEGDIPPVSIPGYPTEDANKNPLTGLLTNQNLTLGTIIGKVLSYIYVIAGLALLLVLIMGGFSLMTAAGDPKKIEAGYGKIKDALIGFLIVFVSYFAVQIVEVVLGVKIL